MLSHFNIEEQKYQHAKHQLAEEDGHELRHHFSARLPSGPRTPTFCNNDDDYAHEVRGGDHLVHDGAQPARNSLDRVGNVEREGRGRVGLD